VVEQAIDKLEIVAPELKVDGHHGYFKKSGDENQA
jgi:N-acetylglucosaminyldiphosphoundecaprenol N-acetyl-beta-D-mannosaminyltransferase